MSIFGTEVCEQKNRNGSKFISIFSKITQLLLTLQLVDLALVARFGQPLVKLELDELSHQRRLFRHVGRFRFKRRLPLFLRMNLSRHLLLVGEWNRKMKL